MPRRRLHLIACLLTALALLAVACKSPSRALLPEVDAAADPIRVAVFPTAAGGAAMETLIAAFAAAYPEYKVEKVELKPGADAQAHLTDLVKRGLVDVVPLGSFDLAGIVNDLQPLDPLIARGQVDTDQLAPFALSSGGQTYGLPYALQSAVLVYNKQMFKEAGLAEPGKEWTWDDFRAAAQKLTKHGGAQTVWGFETGHYEYLARAYVEGKSGLPVWQSPPAVVGEALQFLSTLVLVDGSALKAEPQAIERDGSASLSFSRTMLRALNQSQAAMTLESPVASGMLGGMVKVPWDVASMPRSAGTKPVSIAEPLLLGLADEARAGSWEFVKTATGGPGAAALARAGYLPVYVSDEVQKAWAERPATLPPGLQTLIGTRWVPWESDSKADSYKIMMFQRAVNRTVSGVATWQEAFAEYQEDIQNPVH